MEICKRVHICEQTEHIYDTSSKHVQTGGKQVLGSHFTEIITEKNDNDPSLVLILTLPSV